jgi:hypothetical protein
MLTYATSVEHDVLCFKVVETPEKGGGTESSDGSQDIENLWTAFCQYGIVCCCCPEMFVCDGRLPEGQAVCNPVNKESPEEEACYGCCDSCPYAHCFEERKRLLVKSGAPLVDTVTAVFHVWRVISQIF